MDESVETQTAENVLNESAISTAAFETVETDDIPMDMEPADASTPRRDDEDISMDSVGSNLSETLVGIRPFPKAGPRKQTRKPRQTRKTAILTDSPEYKKLAE